MSEKRLTGWNKQTYCYTRSEDAKFKPGLRGAALYHDFGIAEATGGQFGAHHTILDKEKHTEKTSTGMHTHDCDFQFVYCLKGSITFVVEGVEGKLHFKAGDSWMQPRGIVHNETFVSEDYECIEIYSPAVFETEAITPEIE